MADVRFLVHMMIRDRTALHYAASASNSATASRILAMTSTPKGQRSSHTPHSMHAEALAGSASYQPRSMSVTPSHWVKPTHRIVCPMSMSAGQGRQWLQ